MKSKLFIITCIFFFSFLFKVSAALPPAPHGVAINSQTNECGGYWSGDKYKTYSLPEGWKVYYPEWGSRVLGKCVQGTGDCSGFQCAAINGKTPKGCYINNLECQCFVPVFVEKEECNFLLGEELCCKKLGYRFISNNIGKYNITKLGVENIGINLIIILGLISIFASVIIGIKFLIRKMKK